MLRNFAEMFQPPSPEKGMFRLFFQNDIHLKQRQGIITGSGEYRSETRITMDRHARSCFSERGDVTTFQLLQASPRRKLRFPLFRKRRGVSPETKR